MKQTVDILKYFGNDAFAQANRDHCFTIEEQLALMVHSVSVPMADRLEDMTILRESADEEHRAIIDSYIEDERTKLERLMDMKGDNIVFVSIKEDILGKHSIVHKSLEDLLAYGGADGLVLVHDVDNAGKRSKCIASVEMRGTDIMSIFIYVGETHDEAYKTIRQYSLYVNTPFEPFDIIKLPTTRGKYIIADMGDKSIDELRAEGKVYDADGWLRLTVPIYVRDESGKLDIEVATCLPWRPSEMQILDESDITMRDINEMANIRVELGLKD